MFWNNRKKIIDEFKRNFLNGIEECKNKNFVEFNSGEIPFDEIPKQLFDLTQLEILRLKSPIKNLTIPSEISKLINLKTLITLGFDNIENIKYLTNLEYLEIFSRTIKSIEPIAKLQKLKVFKIIPSVFISDYSLIGELINLQEFEIRHTWFKSFNLSFVSKMPNLKKLSVYEHNRLTNIDQFSEFNNLEEINLDNNSIYDISLLGNLLNLKKLCLRSNKINNIIPLYNLKNIVELDLSYNLIEKVSIENILSLTNLNSLNLQGNPINNIDKNIIESENCLPLLKKLLSS